MLSLQEIENQYPESIRGFKRSILREYLQYKILRAIFDSKYANNLSFLGGTLLRIIYNNSRFSEDLDFDNFNLTESDFEEISYTVKKELELEGYSVELRTVFKGAYRCYIKIPNILFDSNLSGYKEEKILIQLDTAPHNFSYTPEKVILNKFDVFTEINVTPLDIVLSQKFYAVFNRKAKKGRDFYDIIFLLSKTTPNYNYLQEKIGVSCGKELKDKLLALLEEVDLEDLANDVKPFLFNSHDAKRVGLFKDYIAGLEF